MRTAIVLVRVVVTIHMPVAALLQGDAQGVGARPLVVQTVMLHFHAPVRADQRIRRDKFYRDVCGQVEWECLGTWTRLRPDDGTFACWLSRNRRIRSDHPDRCRSCRWALARPRWPRTPHRLDSRRNVWWSSGSTDCYPPLPSPTPSTSLYCYQGTTGRRLKRHSRAGCCSPVSRWTYRSLGHFSGSRGTFQLIGCCVWPWCSPTISGTVGWSAAFQALQRIGLALPRVLWRGRSELAITTSTSVGVFSKVTVQRRASRLTGWK